MDMSGQLRPSWIYHIVEQISKYWRYFEIHSSFIRSLIIAVLILQEKKHYLRNVLNTSQSFGLNNLHFIEEVLRSCLSATTYATNAAAVAYLFSISSFSERYFLQFGFVFQNNFIIIWILIILIIPHFLIQKPQSMILIKLNSSYPKPFVFVQKP